MISNQDEKQLIKRVRYLLNAGFDIPKVAKQLHIEVKKVNKLILKTIPTDKIYFERKQPYWLTEDEMEIPKYTMEGLSENEREFYHSSTNIPVYHNCN